MLILFQSPTPPRTSYAETWPTNQSHHTLSMSPLSAGYPPSAVFSAAHTQSTFSTVNPHHWSVTVHPPAAQHTHMPS
ncbi:hypothetical protein CKAH01_02467 [Colletotrichum kahawae]|uniref:Uncharacterized protein n=1 Tax=Colletotrichum kahawae TaxID=34407 RepID=A0AAD9XYL9_COLKA|nr:hypothetical protein CKAH01_02467 [Colletotrichum kahawae]